MGWDGVGVQATLLFPIISLSRQDASLSLSFPAILHFLDSPTQYTDYKKGASMKILFCTYDINLRIEQCLILRVPISNISNIDSANFRKTPLVSQNSLGKSRLGRRHSLQVI